MTLCPKCEHACRCGLTEHGCEHRPAVACGWCGDVQDGRLEALVAERNALRLAIKNALALEDWDHTDFCEDCNACAAIEALESAVALGGA